VTLGNGATQAIETQITSLGTNLLMVSPGQRIGGGGAQAQDGGGMDAARTRPDHQQEAAEAHHRNPPQ